MKKTLLFFVFVVFVNMLLSQTTIKCEGCNGCDYNHYTKEYDMNCKTDKRRSCVLVFNDNETVFSYIVGDLISTCYVQGKIETTYDKDGDKLFYCDFVSEAGNRYGLIISFASGLVIFLNKYKWRMVWYMKE